MERIPFPGCQHRLVHQSDEPWDSRQSPANVEVSKEGVKEKFFAVNETIAHFHGDELFMENLKEHLPEDTNKSISRKKEFTRTRFCLHRLWNSIA
jgi:hypothetical protein